MSSLVRRIQIKLMKKRGDIEKVPCPYGTKEDSGMVTEKGEPIMVPVMVWPRKVEGQLSPTNPPRKKG